jgi:hypothetical protein
MGLGLRARAALPRRLLRRQRFEDLAPALERSIRASAGDGPLGSLVEVVHGDGEMSLQLHPVEEPVELGVEGDDVVVSAKTSTAGPGYHAWLVEALEAAALATGLGWRWVGDDGADGEGDETGYQRHRDGARLQADMAKLLSAMVKTTLEDPTWSGIALGMPVGFRVESDDFVVAPRGPRTRAWCERIAAARGGELLELAAGYFPWWPFGQTAEFHQGLAEALCWSVVPWRAPADDRERRCCAATLEALRRAPAPPLRETAELRALLETDGDVARPPAAEGMGYHRRLMRRPLDGGWSLALPGFYREVVEDGTRCFSFGDRAVWASSFRADAPRDTLLGGRETEPEVQWEAGPIAARAWFVEDEEDGQPYSALQGHVATDGKLLTLTITFFDPADGDWAREVLASARLG